MTAHWEAQLTDISQNRRVISNLCLRLINMLPDLVRFVDFTALRRLKSDFKGLSSPATENEKERSKIGRFKR